VPNAHAKMEAPVLTLEVWALCVSVLRRVQDKAARIVRPYGCTHRELQKLHLRITKAYNKAETYIDSPILVD